MREDPFYSHVNMNGDCWLWTAYVGHDGYPLAYSRLRKKPMHGQRVAWEIERGAIPEGMHVLHRCDNPLCVRIDHLFLGTIADNNRDMASKKRHWMTRSPHKVLGENNNAAKLAPEQVRSLRREYAAGESVTVLCTRYNISRGQVWKIGTHRSYPNVE